MSSIIVHDEKRTDRLPTDQTTRAQEYMDAPCASTRNLEKSKSAVDKHVHYGVRRVVFDRVGLPLGLCKNASELFHAGLDVLDGSCRHIMAHILPLRTVCCIDAIPSNGSCP